MQASDVNKYLKDTANDPESLWLIVASVVFFPLVLAWAVWKLFNKGADAFQPEPAADFIPEGITDNRAQDRDDDGTDQ